ncbi:MAG: hypothetical protein QOD30_1716 [Actinomycetota bacterium]|jgi:hypothetical protein|nr:hypothetical protein [Actinomycetota bacterium]
MAEAMKEVVATYPSAEAARTAIQVLERTGIDAERIRMIDTPGLRAPTTDDAMREPDMAVTGKVGSRAASVGVALAIVVGVAAFLVTRFALDAAPGPSLMFGVGGAIAGGALGMLFGGYSSLAVSDEWGESFGATGPATIAVHAPADEVVDLRDTISSTHPDRIAVS